MPEQRALEKALRNNPARPNEPPAERWQRIADEVGTRTRRECMLRFKDLAEQVRGLCLQAFILILLVLVG